MKKNISNLKKDKHIFVKKLQKSEMKLTFGGAKITCGGFLDECKSLSVVLQEQAKTHKVVLC